ncbi:MAG TPA: hypothetical protein PLR94_12615 [Accumulibacter sp.]|uniref:hypothetical protein n=1 Tax=Accumulibacter sp. TaxID=2053492 RepID=UPI002CBBDF17|nr:hypothetical protein [Accumulibacter sp.]HNK04194.1 hypothetical protein [Accumulibacter sp.]
MSGALVHPHWYRIAELHPTLRGHVVTRRHVVRGEVWYVLSDPAEDRHFRLNPAAYRFVGLCDGRRSVEEVWHSLNDALGEAAPTQAEVVNIIARLSHGNLLRSEVLPDVDLMFEQRTIAREQQRWSQLNPLFFRVGLLDPSAWLLPFDPWLKRLFSRTALLLWCALLVVAATAAAVNWSELVKQMADRMHSPASLLLTWLAYPLIKTLHELGHALAIRRWGGSVRKIGVTLIFFMPVPWVDAAASAAFPLRRQRLIVSAAGMMVEALLGALALAVWLTAEAGSVREAALAVVLVAGVSTLFFNGNPLMRYDGYFILTDLLDLPNLAARSNAYWTFLIRRHLFRIDADEPATAPGERRWLVCYSPASLIYRVIVALSVVVWLSTYSAPLAGVAALGLIWGFFAKPGIALWRALWQEGDDPRQARRARRIAYASATLVAVALFACPFPLRVVTEGIIWLPEDARVRPETDGFIIRTLVADGSSVSRGQVLFELADAELLVERERLSSRLAQLQAEQYAAFPRQAERAQNLAEEIESVRAALALNETRVQNLQVRAGSSGRLVVPREADLAGRFAARGTDIAYILGETTPRVRAVLAQQDVSLISERLRGAEVWQSESATTARATPGRTTPAATSALPSAALGDRAGGRIVTDPQDRKGVAALEPVFVVDLDLPGQLLERVGARAEVRFDLGWEPLAGQAWRRLRQTFLSHLSQVG